jgi:hypothetical protein
MKSSAKQWLYFLLIIVLVSLPAFSQSNPNEEQELKPFDALHGGDLDSISLTSGGLSIHIPLASFPQRGNLDLSFFVSFSNKQWYIKPARLGWQGQILSPAMWMPMPNTGVQIVSSTDWWLNTCSTPEPQDPNMPGQTLYDWSDSVSSPEGSTHLFGDQIAAFSGPLYPMHSLDASGLLRPDANTLILANGTRYLYSTTSTCPSPFGRIRGGKQANTVTDANGNRITISSSGWTDTMGRFIPGSTATAVQGIQPGVPTTDLSKCPSGTSSALIWNVPGVANVNGDWASDAPGCSTVAKSGPIPVIHYSRRLQLEGNDAWVYRPTYPSEIVVQVEYEASGALACASPLSGYSAYWPTAIQALSRKPVGTRSSKLIVVFADPGQPDLLNDMKDKALQAGGCSPAVPLERLLRLGRVLLSKPEQYRSDARSCFELAGQIDPGSYAAHYGTAIAEELLAQNDSAVAHYAKVVQQRPQFYEAQIRLARLYGRMGLSARQEALLNGLLQANVPLPAKAAASGDLVRFHDSLGREAEAITAKQSWITASRQMQNLYPPLAEDFFLVQESQDLGLRLEEQKRYREAAARYQDAADFAARPGSKVSEADQFTSEMGRSRCLRKAGDLEAANGVCSTWKRRLGELGPDLENVHWAGRELAYAKWELSCGDFKSGLKMVRAVAEQDLREKDQGDPYRLAAPYRALDTIYRALGDKKLAKVARDAANRIQAERSAQIMRQIFEETEPLYPSQ